MGTVFRIRVRRYDPGTQKQPRYRSYDVEAEQRPTVLELLKEIYRRHDGGLSFRWSCGTGKCGACAVQVNGRRTLACQEIAGEKELTIEPARGFLVIRDLTVALDKTVGASRADGDNGRGGER
jgi:succinate dehydrogenase/fumarate reductase iron-sulfur protein